MMIPKTEIKKERERPSRVRTPESLSSMLCDSIRLRWKQMRIKTFGNFQGECMVTGCFSRQAVAQVDQKIITGHGSTQCCSQRMCQSATMVRGMCRVGCVPVQLCVCVSFEVFWMMNFLISTSKSASDAKHKFDTF